MDTVPSGLMPCELLVVEGTCFQSEADILAAIEGLRSAFNTSTGDTAMTPSHSLLLDDIRSTLINMRQVEPSERILESIIGLRETIALSSASNFVGLLGDAYFLHWEVSMDPFHLIEAQRFHQLAIKLSTPPSTCQYLQLTRLANDHIAHYGQDPSVSHAELAFSLMKQAMTHFTDEHKHYVLLTSCMAQAVGLPLSPHYSPAQTFDLLEELMSHEGTGLSLRLSEALRVITSVEHNMAPTWSADEPLRLRLLNAYDIFISSLAHFSAFGFRKDIRMHTIIQGRYLPTKAASHALSLARPDVRRAIDFIDSTRATLLTQFSQMSIDVHENVIPAALVAEAKAITTQFTEYRSMLPAAASQFLRPECAVANRLKRFMSPYQKLIGSRRLAAPGGSKNIVDVAKHGPVVVLFTDGQDLWALVIKHHSRSPTAHQLMGMTCEELHDLARRTELHIKSASETRARAMRKDVPKDSKSAMHLDTALEELWNGILWPLIEIMGLKKQAGAKRPHVTLCPNGVFTFLPLHAAGIYRQGNKPKTECVSDYMVVSYTPAVKVMGKGIKRASRPLSKKTLRALLAAVPASVGMSALPEALDEVEAISQLFSPSQRIVFQDLDEKRGFETRSATADDVLSHLSEADLLHLACHGQSEEFSFDTGFMMADRVLRVADLLFLYLPRARFAFLGACETAKPGRSAHHSAMHLAATLLYAGFHSVVGTMWSMGDIDGAKVSLEVYGAMLTGDSDMVDLNVVPYALDTAIRKLREAGVSSDRWATYMHFGV